MMKDSTNLGASAWRRTALSWELWHGEGQHLAGSFGMAKDSTKLVALAWHRTALSWELWHGKGQH